MTNPGGSATPNSDVSMLSPDEQRKTRSKVTWRLIPLLFFCYIIAYIDRINVGFAKLHLREPLGVDEAIFNSVYGFGAGLFFIGYFIFEVPSNLILQRVGARIWIARIMIFWGIVSACFMFIKGAMMFYCMRFLLGAAEAGFFPGVILYLTYWYPAKERARVIAMFATGGVLAGVIGSPISGALLSMNGIGGLHGWQWLFLLEALPAVVFGFVVLFALPNGPKDARWLSPAEARFVEARVEADSGGDSSQTHRLRDAFTSGRVWLCCLIYFLTNIGGYGYELWLPTIIKNFSGKSDSVVGLINAIPYLIAGVVMLLVARHSDKTSERRGHIAACAVVSALGFALSAYFKNPYLMMAALALAFAGQKSTIAVFWAMTTGFLSGPAAAGGIALINSVGNLGGFVGPYVVGIIKDKTGSNVVPLLFLGGALLCMAILTFAVRPAKRSSLVEADPVPTP